MDTERATFPTADRLQRFIRAANESHLSPVRRLANFVRIAKEQVGGAWWSGQPRIGERPANERMPISYLGEMVRTMHPHLMGDVLLPVVEPSGLGNRGDAAMLQMRLRQWSDDAKYAATDEASVLNALLGISIQYVYRCAGGNLYNDGDQTLDEGEPAVSNIPIDRMVVDPHAESWEDASAIGHWLIVDRRALLDHEIGNPDVLASLPNAWQDTHESREGGNERDRRGKEDEYLDDSVLLWELTFRHAGRRFRCCLPPVDGGTGFVIDPYEPVDEPEGSPYVITALNTMPGDLTPASPAMVMMDSHLAKSGIVARLVHQIETLQRKYAIAPGMQDAVMRLQDQSGDSYVVCDPDKIKEFVQGGMVKELVDGLAMMEAIGEKVGPNVAVLAGQQGEASESATSTSMRAGNGAIVVNHWRRKIDTGRTEVLRRVAAMLLQGNDVRTFEMPVPGGNPIPLVWSPATMDLSHDQFRYRVKPSSNTAGMDARARLRSMNELFMALPGMVQIVMGFGGDPSKVIRVISDMAEMPELDEILPTGDYQTIQASVMQMLAQQGKIKVGPGGQGGGMPGGQLPNAGPMGAGAQLQSDATRAVPV